MSAALPADAVEAFRAYDRNLRWAKAHPEVLEQFEDRFVAVSDQKVVADASTKEDVASRVHGGIGVYIFYVPKKGLIWIL